VQIRFLLGPAGSGKTFRCLAQVRAELLRCPDGPPLIFLAPKQATYQLERQLLADAALPGFTRLQILSFDRLARFVFEQLQQPPPKLLDEEGRVMVLRGLLAKKRDELKLFRASARLTGFAQQLSLTLRELQRNQLAPAALFRLAAGTLETPGLALKLHDLATLLQHYLDWLQLHGLQDADCLLDAATTALRGSAIQNSNFNIGNLWLDGFAEFSAQELALLAAFVPRCAHATLAFCLDREPKATDSWLAPSSVVRRTLTECQARLSALPGADAAVEILPRDLKQSRFSDRPALARLENCWASAEWAADQVTACPEPAVRVVVCPNPEGEAVAAAREILRFVRAGGRFREAGLLLRRLEGHHEALQSVFARYDIPFFLDRRESVAHHPLAELTRAALRVVTFGWAHDDWFAALKTGLVPVAEAHLDRLENEALGRGWSGAAWRQPLTLTDDPERSNWAESLRQKIVPPFEKLLLKLNPRQHQPTGPELAAALREFWRALDVAGQLQAWADAEIPAAGLRLPASVHATVLEQMQAWLDNLELGFPATALPLREWLPILEAGLANLTVGVIPPALDQVLIGAIDRARNPDLKLAVVLGLNESVFPAPPEAGALLTESDRAALAGRGVRVGLSAREQLGRERYYGYIACTRARQQLVLTCAKIDADNRPLNPSPFLSNLKRIFPTLEFETAPTELDWRDSEHASELIAPLLRIQNSRFKIQNWKTLTSVPALAGLIGQLRQFKHPDPAETLGAELAGRLFGKTLRTSVSRLEQFATCPFRFFVHSGLRAEERRTFELDAREQGSFQHDALKMFHEQLHAEHKRWRDVTPLEARERMGSIAAALAASYRDGLLQASDETKFLARVLGGALQDFVETLVGWMRGQYHFDPVAVELAFGESDGPPPWELELGDGHRLALRGRIDRVDVCVEPKTGAALGVVVDYKSSQKQLDPLLVAHGIQLQLLAYLNVLRHWPDPRNVFGAAQLVPAGVFYVNLRGKYERESNRTDALADTDHARRLAYRHTGRFDARALRRLDARAEVRTGDQFNYRLNADGGLRKDSREALPPEVFARLLEDTEANLQRLGREIFSGIAAVAPYRKGTTTACDHCDYRAICRIDPWTHPFLVLRAKGAAAE